MKFKSLSSAFFYLFLLIVLIFFPDQNLNPPLSVSAALSWIGIFLLVFFISKSLHGAQGDEYREFYFHVKSKVPSRDQEIIESDSVKWLVHSGLFLWFVTVLFKNSFFPVFLFVLGSVLLVWGLSIFLEENGFYKFSESKLSNKWVLSSVGSAGLYWSGFKSMGQVNSVFGIDPGFFPFTLAAMVLLNLITLFSFVMIPVFIITIIIMVVSLLRDAVGKNKRRDSMISMVIMIFSMYAAFIGLTMQSPKVQDNTVRSIAMRTDFNFHHRCVDDWLKEKPVIFIGPNSTYVLAQSQVNENEFEVHRCLNF